MPLTLDIHIFFILFGIEMNSVDLSPHTMNTYVVSPRTMHHIAFGCTVSTTGDGWSTKNKKRKEYISNCKIHMNYGPNTRRPFASYSSFKYIISPMHIYVFNILMNGRALTVNDHPIYISANKDPLVRRFFVFRFLWPLSSNTHSL